MALIDAPSNYLNISWVVFVESTLVYMSVIAKPDIVYQVTKGHLII